MQKTFLDLVEDVHTPGRCNHCGGCVSFCSAINYGALDLDHTGQPFISDREKCIECGLCYSVCPQTRELDGDIQKHCEWKEPYGRVIQTAITHACNEDIRASGTDGGVVTAVLTHLLTTGRINGAIVSKQTGHGRVPCVAKTKQEILDSAGSHFGASHGMIRFASEYSTFSPTITALGELRYNPLDRLAFVGTPCQIASVRKMQALGIVPSDAIHVCLGLFCSGNFHFTEPWFKSLEKDYDFDHRFIEKINIKEQFAFFLSDGRVVKVPIDRFDPVRRPACGFCTDFSAAFADISFGGLGAEEGWTTAVIRTPLGKELFDHALAHALVPYRYADNPRYISQAEEKIYTATAHKKAMAEKNSLSIH
ncbi:MAG: coenzyme F420 hydrogenase [Desulfobacteraceae bacterium]|nr:MAG: coenzyme F420 hydrogenase [Desulfobacteraceae bacterium]